MATVGKEIITAKDIDERLNLNLANDRKVTDALKRSLKTERTKRRFAQRRDRARPQNKQDFSRLQDRFIRDLRAEIVRSFRKKYRKETLDELIGESLIIQKGKELKLAVSDDQVTAKLKEIASGNKNRRTGKPLTVKQLVSQVTRIGVRESHYRRRLKALMTLSEIVRKKYGRQINISASQVDRAIQFGQTAKAKKSLEFQLQKIRFALTNAQDQNEIMTRFAEAQQFQARFSSCEKTATLVQSVPNVTLQVLGKKSENEIPAQRLPSLKKTPAGKMTPPFISKQGTVDLYAVCSKRVVLADEKERLNIQADLRSKEFRKWRKRFMQDIRSDAYIEYR